MKRQQKLDCQKIKELILNEIIDINSLQENELEILIDFEEENIIKCDIEYDMTFLNKCMVALKKFQNYENMFSEQNMETISNSAYQQYVSKFSNNSLTPTLNTKKNIPMKKMIRICVSVGALILLITGLPASGFACSSVNRAVIDTPIAAAILATVSTVGFFSARSICPKWAALMPALNASSSWLICRSFRSSRMRSPSAVAISRNALTSHLS